MSDYIRTVHQGLNVWIPKHAWLLVGRVNCLIYICNSWYKIIECGLQFSTRTQDNIRHDMDSIIGAYYVVSSAFSIKHIKLLINCVLPEQHHTTDMARLAAIPIVPWLISTYNLLKGGGHGKIYSEFIV